MLKYDFFGLTGTVFVAQVAVSFHAERPALLVSPANVTVGMSTPFSMQRVANRWRKS